MHSRKILRKGLEADQLLHLQNGSGKVRFGWQKSKVFVALLAIITCAFFLVVIFDRENLAKILARSTDDVTGVKEHIALQNAGSINIPTTDALLEVNLKLKNAAAVASNGVQRARTENLEMTPDPRKRGELTKYLQSNPPLSPNPLPIESVGWAGCLDALPKPDNRKHIVQPPSGPVVLVCCNTTKGTLNIEVHPTWAPIGAENFLEMVRSGFFETRVGLFRALQGFLVQFGLSGDPKVQTLWHKKGNLKDDPSWLPLGPPGREINGTKRFQKGYLAYAGGGKNSRSTQLIMAFDDNLYLGGGSPWEVPFGQLFGENSFETLKKIYTGYHEKPSQGKIMNRGAAYLDEEFPKLDFINNCKIIKEKVPWSYNHKEVMSDALTENKEQIHFVS